MFAVGGTIEPTDLSRLCDALRRLIEGSDVEVVICDLSTLMRPDAATVDALARLQLTARRLGCGVRLRNASPELRELISFMGLTAPLRSSPVPAPSCSCTRRRIRRV